MTHTRAGHTFRLGIHTLAILFAGIVVFLSASAASAEETMLLPVAPPEDAELPYNVPLQPWLVPTVLELKTRYADGLAHEFGVIAETRSGDDLTVLVEAGGELADAAAAVGTSIKAIGELDVTFGIEGISRIIPAESALRDTLFGYVVWHEFSSAPARDMMTRFEELVDHVVAGGEAAGTLTSELDTAQGQLEEAVELGSSSLIAELAPVIVETSNRINSICLAVAGDAHELSAIVDSLGENSGELLAERWAEASRSIDAVRLPAEKSGPALDAMSEILALVVALGDFYGAASTSIQDLSAAPDADGNLYIPWMVVRRDWESARELEAHIIEERDEPAGGGHDHGEHECAHGYGYLGHAAGDESRARLAALLPAQVQANAILAERAVEHMSTMVSAAIDALEETYLREDGYSSDLSERRRRDIFEDADRKLRENLDLSTARIAAKEARASIARSRQHTAAGAYVNALYHYHNAWLHSLNAGASALRAVRAG
jgi:hypothetical protein